MIGEGTVRERVEKMEIRDCIDSDHLPLVVWLERMGGSRGVRKEEKRREEEGGE